MTGLHRPQARKGAEILYISHLLSTSSLIIEYDGDQTIAGPAARRHRGPGRDQWWGGGLSAEIER